MSKQDDITEIESLSSAKAVLLGALAPGVNGPSWNVLKMVFLMLGLCVVAMFSLAFTSRDSGLVLHVLFLGVLAIGLFVLLSRFLEQTGLVTVEHQLQEMGLIPKDTQGSDKNNFKRYLIDCLKRREMHKTAAVSVREANVPESPVAVDSPPYGVLTEWWAIFSDAYFNKPENSPSREMPSGSTMGKEIQSHHHQAPECSLNKNCSALSPAWGNFDLVRQLNRHPLQDGNHFTSEAALSAVDDAFVSSLLEEAPVQTEANQFLTGFELQEPSTHQELSAKYLAPVEGNFAQTHLGSSSLCAGNVMQLSRNSGKVSENGGFHMRPDCWHLQQQGSKFAAEIESVCIYELICDEIMPFES